MTKELSGEGKGEKHRLLLDESPEVKTETAEPSSLGSKFLFSLSRSPKEGRVFGASTSLLFFCLHRFLSSNV